MKYRIWEAGAEAFAKLGLDLPKMYACPLCLRGCDKLCIDNKNLTLEHVPPKSVGGKKLVLTCHDCNSRAGHNFEVDLSEFEKLRREKEDTGSISLKGKLTTDHVKNLNVKVRISPVGIDLGVRPKNNCPGAPDVLFKELGRRHSAGQGFPKFELSLRRPRRIDSRRVEISWLKAGYLAAFAVFGYRYAVRPELNLVRKQIKHPDKRLIEGFAYHVPNADNGERHFVLVREPEWARGIAIQMGSIIVLLPFDDSAELYYSRISSHDGERHNFNGAILDWPQKPAFDLDHNPGNADRYLQGIEGC